MAGAKNPASRQICAGLLALVVLAAASPRLAQAESLNEALASAYSFNPQLEAARASTRATDENVSQARAGFLPEITGNLAAEAEHREYGVDGSELNNLIPGLDFPDKATITSNSKPYGYSLTLQQSIFNGLQTLNNMREAEANSMASREDLRNTEQTTLLDGVTAYMGVVQNQAIVRLRENNVNVLSKYQASNQRLFKNGELTRTDLEQSKAQRATSLAQLEAARGQLQASQANYEQVIGHPPGYVEVPPSIDHLLPGNMQEALEIAQVENPNIGSALFQELAARKSVDALRGQFLPQVNLQLKYQDTENVFEGLDYDREASASLGVKVPFYQGGKVESQVRQAKQVQIQRLAQTNQARQQTRNDVVSAWTQLTSAEAQLSADEVSVESNKIALAGVRREQKAGTRTVQDVLNAEQNYLTAQVQIVTDEYNVVVARYTLLQAIGRMTASYLRLPTAVYNASITNHSERHLLWRTQIKPEVDYYGGAAGGWESTCTSETSFCK